MSGAWGVAVSDLSAATRPGDDFFRHVNDHWIQRTKPPAGYSAFLEMNAMFLRTEGRIRDIILDPRNEGAGRGRGKIEALFRSYTDLKAIESAGLRSVRPDLDAILGLRTPADIAAWMARPAGGAIVGKYVYVDAGDPRRNALHLDQQILGSRLLGLSEPGAYLRTDGSYPARRDAYRAYVAAQLGRAGVDHPERRAAEVLDIETKLARTQWTPAQLRDRKANYHPLTPAELEHYAPGFPWASYLKAAGVAKVRTLVLNTDTSIKASATIFAETPVDAWRSYLVFHELQAQVPLLPQAYRQAWAEYRQGRAYDPAKQRQRESEAVQFVNENLGDLVGEIYVARHFPPSSRRQLDEMAGYLRRAYAHRIRQADWLDAPTRSAALAKLQAMTIELGNSDRLRTYDGVELRADDLIGNVRRLKAADWEFQRLHLGKSPRTWGWHLPPQQVDATYTPQLNRIVFPAGLLQAPAFDPCADPAVNFGAIGAILGHEMGHGFDDQGAGFDAAGKLRNWWSPAALTAFKQRGGALAAQYSRYEVAAGVHLDGARSLGENLADLAGVTVALDAYRLYLKDKHGGVAPVLDGFTGEQRFFIGWAQYWRAIEPEGWLKQTAQQGYHSPPRFRVNGVLRNLDAWHEAFEVKPGDQLFLGPEERVRIW